MASAEAMAMLTTIRPRLIAACSKSSRLRARSKVACATASGEGSSTLLSVHHATPAQTSATTAIVRR
jgi:hypothetical protein